MLEQKPLEVETEKHLVPNSCYRFG